MSVLDSCARVLNRHVAESTAATQRLAALEGRSFAVEVTGLDLRVVLRARGERIALSARRVARSGASLESSAGAQHVVADARPADSEQDPADATIAGTPLDLLALLRSSTASGLSAGRATLSGSVEVAEGFAAALRLARPDLEAELALWIGDIAAHEAAEFARRALAWTERAGRALEADVAEYLQEERPWLPAPAEARGFYADVERLRDDVERLARRVAKVARGVATDT